MRWLAVLGMRLRMLFGRGREIERLDEELQFHLDRQIAENLAAGMSAEEARKAALREFGNPALLREQARAAWSWNWLELLMYDLRYAVRSLRQSPGFTLTALLTLTLAIGANTTIFSLLNAVLLRSLPVRDPQRLAVLNWTMDDGPDGLTSTGYSNYEFSYPAFEHFAKRRDIFSSVFGVAGLGFNQNDVAVTVHGNTTPATASMVTGGYFSGLGIVPAAGRLLDENDLQSSAPRAAVISYAYWQKQFAGSLTALGQSISLNGRSYTIVGVAAPRFTGLQPGLPEELWIPVTDDTAIRPWASDPPPGQSMFASRQWSWLTVVGRLQPGVTPRKAQAALEPEFAGEIREAAGNGFDPGKKLHFQVLSGGRGLQFIQDMYDKPARILMALVALVLLAACANLATLLLARGSARAREIAVRLALGASRARVLRQLLMESLLLSIGGGACGILLAIVTTHAFKVIPSRGVMNVSFDLGPDHTVLAFTAMASILTGVLFGLVPALRATRVDVNSTLKGSVAATTSSDRRSFVLNQSLVAAQAAISVFLLIGSGLFLHSFERLSHQSTGFDARHMLVFQLTPLQDGYKVAQLPELYERVHARLAALPGVHSVTEMRLRLVDNWISNFPVKIEGYKATDGNDPAPLNNFVGPRFLETTGIPLLAGRDFQQTDTASAPKVAIINQAFVEKFFAGRNPIGYHIRYREDYFSGKTISVAIVGVCGNTIYENMHRQAKPTWYSVFQQDAAPLQIENVNFVLRADSDPGLLANSVRAALREIDPGLLVGDLRTQAEQIDYSIAFDRMFTELLIFFGALALLLAAIGLYGTLSYNVARRTRELGIRMALGAQRGALLRSVLVQGLRWVFAGILLGGVAAALSERIVRSMLFGVQPLDWLSFVGAGCVLIVVAILAAYGPAHRAAIIEPMRALRME